MKPRPRPNADQLDLFQAQFSQILNPLHPLVVLADKIDWQRFDGALADCVSFRSALKSSNRIFVHWSPDQRGSLGVS